MTTSQRDALRALLAKQNDSYNACNVAMLAALEALPSLLARLDTAERLLGEAMRPLQRLSANDDCYGRDSTREPPCGTCWFCTYRPAAAKSVEAIRTFLAAKE